MPFTFNYISFGFKASFLYRLLSPPPIGIVNRDPESISLI